MPRYETVAVEDAFPLIGKEVVVWDNNGCGQGGILLTATPEIIAVCGPLGDVSTFFAPHSSIQIEKSIPVEECLEYGSECRGEVDYRSFGYGSTTIRCDYHWDKRIEIEDGIRERYPDNPPSDWSPMDAGESWYEDY